ncbi:hypothetical protein GUJ93_ZPchr0008g13175 [Zizania palustris]|uniref:Uncharacterized protein n=1 Tax=Zizania palustris TaxID=103762 RepID=A0A8J5R3X1_ZIZPA|nr:hypothetical protein GUJ93_ZPchr0008g13175 [Zizania palustris]
MARDDQLLGGFLLLLLFVLQIPSLHSRCLAHAAAVDDDGGVTTAAGRRLLQALAAPPVLPQSVPVKVTAHPRTRSMERRRGRPAMLAAVSKHQVPSGANPDSN